jgi:hypothetical protein
MAWDREATGVNPEAVGQFEFVFFLGCIIAKPGAVQPGEGSPVAKGMRCAGDPSLRLKNGSAQDDAARRNSN